MREPAPCLAAVLLIASTVATQVDRAPKGLPRDLLPVPAGEVRMGRTAAQLDAVARQLHPDQPERRRRALRQMLSELGPQRVEVPAFLLHRWQVTNEQYRVFVTATGHRFPFDWWRRGAPDDFASRRSDARKKFPKRTRPTLDYWEMHWGDLSSALPEGREKYPVNFVSWQDARAFAAWAGMRLPTEAQWMRAAVADGGDEFLSGDLWDPAWLAELQAQGAGALQDVGSLGASARGPFGHEDLVGNVWEWLDQLYEPLVDRTAFSLELLELHRRLKDMEEAKPAWGAGKRVLKGGSYLSRMNPVELRAGSRAALETHQTVEAAGLRLAKSPQPGRDLCRYRIETEHGLRRGFGHYGLEHQIGVERYQMDESGSLILGYETVSIVPLADRGLEARTTLAAVLDAMRQWGGVVGALVTTEPLAEPPLGPGTYAIAYQARGLRGDPARFTFRGVDQSVVVMEVDQPDPSLSTTAPKSSVRRVVDPTTKSEWLHFSFPSQLSADSPRHMAFQLSVRLKKAPDSERPWR